MTAATSVRIPLPLLIGTGLVVFLANAGLLVLQLVAGRLLSPFIGSSIETWTSVIGVFLTGIALGNWLGGRIADRFPSPKAVAAVLLLGGASTLGMVACYHYAQESNFYRDLPLRPRIPLLALMFCLAPAFVLSLLTPLTIKLLLPDVGSSGRVAGLIFALSTLGCLVGNYVTGFWLMAEFKLNNIINGVGIGLMILALPMFFLRRVAAGGGAETATGPGPSPDDGRDGAWSFRSNIRIAYLVVFLSSFCGMSLELTGTRLLAPVLGVSLYTWTGIIGVMLAGTCSGNYLGGILADRGVGPAFRRFAIILALLAGAAAGPPLVHWMAQQAGSAFDPYSSAALEYSLRVATGLSGLVLAVPATWLSKRRWGAVVLFAVFGGMVGMLLAHSVGRMIDEWVSLPGFTEFHRSVSQQAGFDFGRLLIHSIGFAFGAVVALLFLWDAPPRAEGVTRSGALSGSFFAAALATLSTLLLLAIYTNQPFMIHETDIVQKVMAWTFGLFFLPMLMLGTISPQVIRLSIPDIKHAGRTAGTVYAWSTIGAIAGTFVTGYFLIASVGTIRVIMILAFVLTVLAFLVGQLWKNNAMLYAASIVCGGAIFGLYIVDYGANRYDRETKYYAIKTWEEKKPSGQTTVALSLDQLTHSIVDMDDPTWLYYEHEYIQGELLMLARAQHPQPHILVIGGGGYTFPRYADLLFPDAHIEVVEIDPGVTEVAHEKLGLPRDTRIRSHHMDGRQFVSERAAPGHYQLVFQDAVNDLSVPAHLMTKEYNDAIKATLAPDGAYLLTFIDSLEHGKLWRAAVNTMRQSFKYVYLLSPKSFTKTKKVDGVVVEEPNIRANREVYVVFGSDQPLNLPALEAVTDPFVQHQWELRENPIGLLSPLATRLAGTVSPWMLRNYTHVLAAEPLDHLLDDPRFKKIILTDQYCPVDNLMSEVFRDRIKP